MLAELRITNFAIIDSLSLSFPTRMSVLSGETGAGKSIIMSALHLVLGGKSTSDQIRSNADCATVEAMFQDSPKGEWAGRLCSIGIEASEEVLLKRVVYKNNRSRQWINGQPVTLSMLATVCRGQVDIASQHQYQSLLRPETHLDILDRFGGLDELREKYEEIFSCYASVSRERDSLHMSEEEKQRRVDYLAFQLDELEKADIKEGEEEELIEELKVLSSAEKLQGLARDAYGSLYDTDGALVEQVGMILRNVREIENVDGSVTPVLEQLQAILYQLEDTASTLREYEERVQYDPQRMEIVESRLEEIRRLKRKYGKTIQEVLEASQQMEEELRSLERSQDRERELDKELEVLAAQLIQKAEQLSEGRGRANRTLSRRMEQELKTLCMEDTAFRIHFDSNRSAGSSSPGSWLELKGHRCGPRGAEEVEFFFSPNVGEPPKPLRKIASGGELSRVMLALQHILTKQWKIGTCVFDEVDAGIGGGVAEVVGAKLKEISSVNQVICITHLPQIVVFADTHFHVYKKTVGQRTSTMVKGLKGKERVEEVARMLGGRTVTQKTLQHAREMVQQAQQS